MWIDDMEATAKASLPKAVYDYFRQGSGSERALREATAAWDDIRLRPRVLRDVTFIDTATTVLGTDVDTPILIAPSTLQVAVHPDGDYATVHGAGLAGSLACISTNAGVPFEKIGHASVDWWIQAYISTDRPACKEFFLWAKENGATALALTVDTPVLGPRKIDFEGFAKATVGIPNAVNFTPGMTLAGFDHNLTFDDISWLATEIGLPVLVKGILRGDDACAAVDAGAAGIIVSNHGGRQVDSAIPTARALPEVADALAGTGAEVFVDGGIRTGEQVFAALALGAKAVLLGRPNLWALHSGGASGVRALIERLTGELELTMRLCGTPTLADVTRDLTAD